MNDEPFIKVYRDHRDVEDVEHEWVVDRQRPVEQMDSEARRAYVGGQPWVSLRCGARRGCDARAFVVESELIACITFPPPKKRVRLGGVEAELTVNPGTNPFPDGITLTVTVPPAAVEPVPTVIESDFERALTQASIRAAAESVPPVAPTRRTRSRKPRGSA